MAVKIRERNKISCQVGALTLLGWYLMCGRPPDRTIPNHGTPTWGIDDSFDTAAECRKYREAFVEQQQAKGDPHALQYAGCACVATDDPRLAK
jgi:hypothetical protein